MADLMKKLKTGKLSALSQQTIQPFEDYEVTDVAEGGITNAQMTLALDESAGSFFKIGSVYLCIDEGTYTKHCFYKWNGVDASTPWEVVGSFANKQDKLTAGENITISENNVISAGTGSLYVHKVYISRNNVYGNISFLIINKSSEAINSFAKLKTALDISSGDFYGYSVGWVKANDKYYGTIMRVSTWDGSTVSVAYADENGVWQTVEGAPSVTEYDQYPI